MMRKLGSALVCVGSVCIVLSLLLAAWNGYESKKAEISSNNIMSQIHADAGIIGTWKDMLQDILHAKTNKHLPDPYDPTMREREIDGVAYIGYLTIPSLELELPIASEWSYEQLKFSPCRYFGSTKTDNLTIAGHSYTCHFGKLDSLNIGDEVIVTDMDHVITYYRVVAKEILGSAAVEDMTDGKYALTLFTCTYDGRNRVTIRCDRIQ